MSFRSLAGGGQACAYCGFCLVVEGPRKCCTGGRDYDALAAEIAALRVQMVEESRRHMEQTAELVQLAEDRRVRLAEAERLLRMAQYDPYDHDRSLTDEEWCVAWRAFFGLTDSAPAQESVSHG